MDPKEIIRYANLYSNGDIARSIADREYPATEKSCIDMFTLCAGRAPTSDELREMRPNTEQQVKDFADEMIANYRSVYG